MNTLNKILLSLFLTGVLFIGGCINNYNEKTTLKQVEEKNEIDTIKEVKEETNETTNETIGEKEGKNKELYAKDIINCNFRGKMLEFSNVYAAINEFGETEISGENEDFKIVIKFSWNESGNYSYDKEKQIDLVLISREIVGREMYYLDYNEKTKLTLERYNEKVSGDIAGEIVELKEKENKREIECSFNTKIIEENEPIKNE